MKYKGSPWVRVTVHHVSQWRKVIDYIDARLFGTGKFNCLQWTLAEAAENVIISYANN
jgi:hypothetical protein